MKAAILSGILFAVALNLCLFSGTAHTAPPTTTQILSLHPGWNSVFLDVLPEDTSPAAVFAALPEESSVWHWTKNDSRVEYLMNPDEGLWNQPGWIAYYKSSTKTFLSSMYKVLPDRAYLIFVAGTADVAIPVSGVPSVKKIEWTEDSFNLIGFPVAPTGAPAITFAHYFSLSPAHTGQPVYTLGNDGQWTLITEPATTTIQPGIAYWVYCKGISSFQGVLELSLPRSSGIEFAPAVVTQRLSITNTSTIAKIVVFQNIMPAVVLTYRYWDETENGFLYPNINSMPPLTLEPGEKTTVTLCVRREAMAAGEAGSVLLISDNTGIFIQTPVWVDRVYATQAAAANPLQTASTMATAAVAAAAPEGMLPGLWVGSVTLNQVSQANNRGKDFYFDLQIIGRKDGQPIVAETDPWKFLAGSQPSAAWRYDPAFDETGWSDTASTPLPADVTGTSYFRKTFNVQAASERSYTDVTFTMTMDDGAAVYLNGKLIHIHNISSLYHDAPATVEVTEEGGTEVEFTIPATMLLPGDNLLAAEVHQEAETSSDLFFSLKLTATLTEEIVPFEAADWHYHDQGAVPDEDAEGVSWKLSAYAEGTGWQSATAPFYYVLNDQVVNSHDLNTDTDTIYFRKTFTVNASDYDSLAARLLYDDGAVLYDNDVENAPASHRWNMPDEGEIDHATSPLAIRIASQQADYTEISLKDLGDGTNTLAIEVHQHPSEVIGIDTSEPQPVADAAALNLRLLLHVGADQSKRLLKEVIMMSNAAGDPVLLTDHEKIPDYYGVSRRDGVLVGRRMSTPGFDFKDTNDTHPGTLVMAQQSGALTCELLLDNDNATNPFLHRYHPDHDNLDARYQPFDDDVKHEVPNIKRRIRLSFNNVWIGDTDAIPPGWGEFILEGSYQETVSGLHKNDITAAGDFILHHISNVDTLNP